MITATEVTNDTRADGQTTTVWADDVSPELCRTRRMLHASELQQGEAYATRLLTETNGDGATAIVKAQALRTMDAGGQLWWKFVVSVLYFRLAGEIRGARD